MKKMGEFGSFKGQPKEHIATDYNKFPKEAWEASIEAKAPIRDKHINNQIKVQEGTMMNFRLDLDRLLTEGQPTINHSTLDAAKKAAASPRKS